jgi:hypothetical protein
MSYRTPLTNTTFALPFALSWQRDIQFVPIQQGRKGALNTSILFSLC